MSQLCRYYLKNGRCRDDDNCQFEHKDGLCRDYHLRGQCRRDEGQCKFEHLDNFNLQPPTIERSIQNNDQSKRVSGDQQTKNNNNQTRNNKKKQQRKPKNTTNFNPSHEPADMRIMYQIPISIDDTYSRGHTSRDVIVIPNLFCREDDLTIYNNLLKEINSAELPDGQHDRLWKSWHGDSHWIADDSLNWKKSCPTFNFVLDRIKKFFKMDIKATRFNFYEDSSEWKPFHHDAAAVKPDKAKTQNFTVAVSFGATREAAFQHVRRNKDEDKQTIISIPQPNGTIYTFGKDVNIEWKHGILQMPPNQSHTQGRISIIAWGWVDQI